MTMPTTAAEFYEAANRAASEAMVFARDPNGLMLATLRSNDARALRARAKGLLTPKS